MTYPEAILILGIIEEGQPNTHTGHAVRTIREWIQQMNHAADKDRELGMSLGNLESIFRGGPKWEQS